MNQRVVPSIFLKRVFDEYNLDASVVPNVVDVEQFTYRIPTMVGARVLSTAVLKPNQRLRMTLNDQSGDVRFRASVAWASFEISSKGPRYRAGIQFLDANAQQVDGYIARHKA